MKKFRQAVEANDIDALIASLAEDVVFRSPVVHKPYQGRAAVGALLRAVMAVFEDFTYVGEINEGDRSMLEFKTRVGDKDLHGIDLGTVNAEGLVTELTVFVRPMSAAQALALAMRAELEKSA